ncbi:alpha/beta fold hydrolase [Arenibaculum sp.]|uniref:alpha/beta hydrolase family protein n=1 Tax=Arenibaculum sp. TaxID=2865862 RepID=UPI002E12FD5F|nr:alpha/beta fold hydrolase [Arenibaculum sp.]
MSEARKETATERGAVEPEAFTARAADGYAIRGFFWRCPGPAGERPVVIVSAATSVRCRYYMRFAAFLFANGFDAIVYDYRGIGESRPASLRGFQGSWLDWGYLDFDAVLRFADRSFPGQPIYVVAHSVGGFVIGLAPSNHLIRRIFTMGAQFAHWRDYRRRLRMLAKWHVAMPALTAVLGYFPGKRLGWLEDTPKGVVRDWGFSWARIEDICRRGALALGPADRQDLVRQFAAVTAPTLAVGVSDDDFGTVAAVERLLAYFRNSPTTHLRISPESIGEPEIGHFAFFHSRFEKALWPIPLAWLRTGKVPDGAPGTIVAAGPSSSFRHPLDRSLALQGR